MPTWQIVLGYAPAPEVEAALVRHGLNSLGGTILEVKAADREDARRKFRAAIDAEGLELTEIDIRDA
jgi:hypothetical protein